MHPKTEMNENKRRSPVIHAAAETGQAIVLVAITMVILLASVGLAIDGGNLYLTYRNVQNAVDSAALTAAFTACTDGDAITAAERSLLVNGVDDTVGGVVVEVNRPPVRNTTYTSNDFIEVYAEVTNPSYFIQIVYPGPLRVSAEAISVCRGGTNTTTTDDIVNRYAYRSLVDSNCSTPGWQIQGTGWTIIGDVWFPSVAGNIEMSQSGVTENETYDNRADIIGNIYIGESATYNGGGANHNNHGDGSYPSRLVEDTADTAANNAFGAQYQDYGGDGVIEYNVPAPEGLPWGMEYFRPGNTLDNSTSSYVDLTDDNGTDWCSHNAFNAQDFEDPNFQYYNTGTKTWTPGIYYVDCNISLDRPNMVGNGVSFITEGRIDGNGAPYDFRNFGDVPLFVSYHGTGGCSNSQYAIKLNAGNSYFEGAFIAFRGSVSFDGNYFTLNSCISARGIFQNGNEGALYACLPSTPVDPVEEYGLVE